MQYARRTPSGICTFCVIRIKNIFKIIGIIITKTKKILFFHERKDAHFKSIFIIKNRETEIALLKKQKF